MPDLSTIASLASIVGVLAAIAALVFAAVQIWSAARTAQGQLILTIDDALRPYEDVRAHINGSDPNSRNVRIRRYIARFERIGILVETRQLSLQRVDQLYGGRIEKLLNYPEAVRMIQNDADGWRGLVYLWQKLEKEYPERSLPDPPHLSGRKHSFAGFKFGRIRPIAHREEGNADTT